MAALESENLPSDSPSSETKDEILVRHKKELKDMQYQNRQRMKVFSLSSITLFTITIEHIMTSFSKRKVSKVKAKKTPLQKQQQ